MLSSKRLIIFYNTLEFSQIRVAYSSLKAWKSFLFICSFAYLFIHLFFLLRGKILQLTNS